MDSQKECVKIFIDDELGRVLQTFYHRVGAWDVPAGRIEKGESPRRAAVRELLERTGFLISENDLQEDQSAGIFYVFKGEKAALMHRADPGERGGYKTSIRWV